MTSKPMTYYISGPMSNIPSFNFPAFDKARDMLLRLGYGAISPADMDRARDPNVEQGVGFATGDVAASGFDYTLALTEDFAAIARADGILLLPGWEASTGANHELYVAKALRKQVRYLVPLTHGGSAMVLEPVSPAPEKPVIIGLCGYAQSGKDTAGAILVEEYGFTRISFADALRDMLYALNPSLDGTLYDRTVQQAVDRIGWDRAKTEYPEIRELLQRLGTEAGRGVLGESIWVDTAMKKIEPSVRFDTGEYRRYVFTDVRFPNEVDATRAAGGTLARVYRAGQGAVNMHASETALDHYAWPADTWGLPNYGSLEQYRDNVRLMAGSILGRKMEDS